jgi:hypothetical protein
MELHQIDVVGAYLQGNLDKEIYMTPPDGLKIKGKMDWILQLKKPLYRLKQVGRQWKKQLDNTMAHLKFTKSAADECLHVLHEKSEVVLLVLIYVDDAAAASKDIHRIQWFKSSLRSFFSMKDLGELQYILRI